jgi:hypothetical protein
LKRQSSLQVEHSMRQEGPGQVCHLLAVRSLCKPATLAPDD